MINVIEQVNLKTDKYDQYLFYCPGCKCNHYINTNLKGKGNGPCWNLKGSLSKPTVTPSILVNRGKTNPNMHTCHMFITDGKIKFLNDCTHKLAGQTVDMLNIEEN